MEITVTRRTFDELARKLNQQADTITIAAAVVRYRGPRVAQVVHGSKFCYAIHRCRCEACREANTLYHRNYRATRKAMREARQG